VSEFEVRSGREIARAAAALRAIDKKLPTKFRTELRKASKPAVAKVKQTVRKMPVKGTAGSTGLRRRVARGVRVQASTKTGVRIVTSMPAGEEVLPRGLDSRTSIRGWRHPVFGRSGIWVRQAGGSWFMEPIAEQKPALDRAMQAVLDDAAATIARAGGPNQ
jgi:hypothetical protein